MHKSHALWLGLPLLLIIIFAVSASYLPGKVAGFIVLGAIIGSLSIVLVMRGRSLFHD